MLLVPDPPKTLPLLTGTPAYASRAVRTALFAAWLATAGWLAWHHVPWRDEVRAWTLARSGDDVVGMLRAIQGEGHPALWYLLLRGAAAVVGARAALPGTAFAVAAAAVALFVARAPFRPLVIALTLASGFCLHEYPAVSRNYGIAMLLLFAWAALYPRWKRRGVGLGVLLALLANTNAPAVLLAGGLGLFWGIELLCIEGWRWTPAWRRWLLNMGVALLGVLACAATVYPPVNDAATGPMAGHVTPLAVLGAALNLSTPMSALLPQAWWSLPGATLLLAAMLAGAPLGLVRSPGGLAAGAAGTVALPLFLQLVYPGGYRHEALAVCYLLTLYWLVADGGGGGRWRFGPTAALRPAVRDGVERAGQGALLALLLTQVAISAGVVADAMRGLPYSHSRDLAAVLARDGLGRAVVMADADVLLEPLPYYAANPIWLTRAGRWGQVVPFTRAHAGALSLDDILATARALHVRTGRPVAIVMQQPIDPTAPPRHWHEGYLGDLSATPASTRSFLRATRLLARFGPAVTDESYAVYRLNDA